jgi:hypothetical protein
MVTIWQVWRMEHYAVRVTVSLHELSSGSTDHIDHTSLLKSVGQIF